MQGRFDEAHRAAEDNLALLTEIGHRLGVASRLFWIGPMRVLAGELEAAEEEYRESIAMLEAMNDKGFVVSIAVDFAEVLALQGKDEEAERYAEYGRTQAISDDVYPQAGWRAAKARVLMNRGELEEAERLAREAVALIERTDFLNLEADSRMRLAEVLQAGGRGKEAADELRRALGLYERKGNVVTAARARAMLDGS
jgi:tetratricopeptide (TPR) repeat protein